MIMVIIGLIGVGKIIFVNLLFWLFDVIGGVVLIDGFDVCEVDFEVLWVWMGLIL